MRSRWTLIDPIKATWRLFLKHILVYVTYLGRCWAVWPDGMIIFQYLAIYNNNNLHQKHTTFTRVCKKIAKRLLNPQMFAKDV